MVKFGVILIKMVKTANILIIGGGIVGTSICYQLMLQGAQNVILVDKSLIGSGDSSASAGSFRHQWATDIRCKLAKKGIKYWKQFAENEELNFYRNGYMFLLSSEKEKKYFDQLNKNWHKLSINSKIINPAEIREIATGINTEGVLAASYSPNDGYADESEFALCCARKARELGAKILVETNVKKIFQKNGKVHGVLTNRGKIEASTIVVAAGAWSKKLMLTAGINVPLSPVRVQVLLCKPITKKELNKTYIREFFTDFYYRWDAGDLLWIGGGTERVESDPDKYRRNADRNFVIEATKRMSFRFPKIEDSSYIRDFAGCVQVTPDMHQIVGQVPNVEGLMTAFGGSGTFACWGLLGQALSELIIEGKSEVFDISQLSMDRFKSGQLLSPERLMSPEEGKIYNQ
jgi:sarcosine oxidase subunit beta